MAVSNEEIYYSSTYQERLLWAKLQLLSPEDQEIVADKLEEILNEREQKRMDTVVSGKNDSKPSDKK